MFYADSADALPLAITISQTLEAAGWSVRIWNGPPGQSVRELRVQTREGAGRTVQEPGVRLMLALQELDWQHGASNRFARTICPTTTESLPGRTGSSPHPIDDRRKALGARPALKPNSLRLVADPDVDRTRLVGHRLDDLGGDFNSSGLQGFSELDGRPFPLLFLSFIDLNLHAEDNRLRRRPC